MMQLDWIKSKGLDADYESIQCELLVDRDSERIYGHVDYPNVNTQVSYVVYVYGGHYERYYLTLQAAKDYLESKTFEINQEEVSELENRVKALPEEPKEKKRKWYASF